MLTFTSETKRASPVKSRHRATFGNCLTQPPQVRQFLREPSVQPKLTISAPSDRNEREADRVTEQVMHMPAPRDISASQIDHNIQRACQECKEELRRQPLMSTDLKVGDDQLQTKRIQRFCPKCSEKLYEKPSGGPMRLKSANDPPSQAPPNIEFNMRAMKGGRRLPQPTRSFFESRFGADFSHVRVHTDSRAVEAANSINAKAFTVGCNIAFGAGQYAPETDSGKRLLAHELTHVLQQGKKEGAIQRLVRNTLVQNCNEDTAEAAENPASELRQAEQQAFSLLVTAIKKIQIAEKQYQELLRDKDRKNFIPTLDELKTQDEAYLVSRHFHRAFGFNPIAPETWDKIRITRIRLMTVIKNLEAIVFEYTCCKQDSVCVQDPLSGIIENCFSLNRHAYVTNKNTSRIVLCSLFWETNPKQRGLTILHEILHLAFIEFITDDPSPAFHDAFNYEDFVKFLNQ